MVTLRGLSHPSPAPANLFHGTQLRSSKRWLQKLVPVARIVLMHNSVFPSVQSVRLFQGRDGRQGPIGASLPNTYRWRPGPTEPDRNTLFALRLQGPAVNHWGGSHYERRMPCPSVLTRPVLDARDYYESATTCRAPGTVRNTKCITYYKNSNNRTMYWAFRNSLLWKRVEEHVKKKPPLLSKTNKKEKTPHPTRRGNSNVLAHGLVIWVLMTAYHHYSHETRPPG